MYLQHSFPFMGSQKLHHRSSSGYLCLSFVLFCVASCLFFLIFARSLTHSLIRSPIFCLFLPVFSNLLFLSVCLLQQLFSSLSPSVCPVALFSCCILCHSENIVGFSLFPLPLLSQTWPTGSRSFTLQAHASWWDQRLCVLGNTDSVISHLISSFPSPLFLSSPALPLNPFHHVLCAWGIWGASLLNRMTTGPEDPLPIFRQTPFSWGTSPPKNLLYRTRTQPP